MSDHAQSSNPLVVSNAREVGDRLRGGAVAIGNFDGLHRGHQALFAAALEAAPERAGVLTFEPHPVKVLAPHLAPPQILTLDEKCAGLAEFGFNTVVVHPFDLAFAQLSPQAFVDDILVGMLKVSTVVVGADFSFGKRGEGKTADLMRHLAAHGATGRVVEPVREGNLVCSSTKIREFVREGRVEAAALLLGHHYNMDGPVVRGDGRGRTIDVPTANLQTARELRPKVGVYATWARIDGGPRRAAVTNVGLRPTFAGETGADVRIETHLLDFDADLYGSSLRVEFVERLREEEKFSGREALVAQIQRDIVAARGVLGAATAPST